MPAEIPGYYFDPEKNKYFKVEHASTAPRAAAWSSDSVKRRRVAAESAATAADDRARRLRGHARRWRAAGGGGGGGALTQDTITRTLLRRQLGDRRADDEGDMRAAAWAGGAADCGSVALAARGRANVPCMYVNGDDTKTGLGVVYAALGEDGLVGRYISTDDNDRIAFSETAPLNSGRNPAVLADVLPFPQLSSITYHAPSGRIITTSRSPTSGVCLFSPPLSDDADVHLPRWLLGRLPTDGYKWAYPRNPGSAVAHAAAPAPASSSSRLVCLVGTSAGVLRVTDDAPPRAALSWVSDRAHHPPSPTAPTTPGETLALDFLHGHPEVFLAGGRRSRLWITDLRAPSTTTTCHRLDDGSGSVAVAHLRSVSEHLLVAAGPPSSMATWDARFLRGGRGGPVARFDGYANAAHVHAGWDLCAELGLVAAAHDDGTVALFSLRSGRRWAPAAAASEEGGPLAAVRAETPVRALRFCRLPRERLPSLFVGEGAAVRKFSLAVSALDDEA